MVVINRRCAVNFVHASYRKSFGARAIFYPLKPPSGIRAEKLQQTQSSVSAQGELGKNTADTRSWCVLFPSHKAREGHKVSLAGS